MRRLIAVGPPPSLQKGFHVEKVCITLLNHNHKNFKKNLIWYFLENPYITSKNDLKRYDYSENNAPVYKEWLQEQAILPIVKGSVRLASLRAAPFHTGTNISLL